MTDAGTPATPPVPESLLALALRSVSEGSLITDARGDTIYANDAFTAITGYNPAEVLGRNCRFLQGEGTSPSELQRMREALRDQQAYQGTILNYRKDGSPFWNRLTITPLKDERGILTHYVSVQRDVTDIVEERDRASHDASHDQLTGLPNREGLRRHLRAELAEAAEDGTTVAVAMIDLDDFKLVNDDYGHASGDLVLVEFAKRMRELLRRGDYIARLGGDEFVLVFSDLSATTALDDLQRILAGVHTAVEVPIEVEGRAMVNVGMSLGVALFPKDASTSRDLLRLADAALYRAKESPSSAHWWEAAGPQDIPVAAEALPGDLVMYMQPIVDLHSGRVRQVEALARLQRTDGEIESPDRFLPTFSRGQLLQVFREGLDQALDWASQWEREGIVLNVSVNIPPELLTTPDSAVWVRDALQRHRMEPHRLGLELLETQEIDLAASDQAVSELVQLGVKIHLDDLSSGFSTLKRITELPFDVIKIDRRFFDQVHSRPLQVLTLFAAITKLGEDFGYGVVVEGIEDMERLEVSAVLGAGSGQGYLFAPPMAPEHVRDWVRGFDSPYREGVLTTALGALAFHWTHTSGNGPEHPPLADCPLTAFLAGSEEELLHRAVHAGDPTAGQELTDALLERVVDA
ncbi:putative bifunctional diguanylate cyclase/phosphodiesterase [Salinibacterium soli]|uniref:EAL domain-containing protein n=1 Tax=Antiquaquibacter soli TaxID=3064523 RepID=A0ABT9BIN8_9MICO|nr:EAL domain-containing protein [Protaetiibacter sp. WY-16]MDO7880889.1 EAL domain-containing protein [Protaetiibacter sp. WY-16]